MSLSRLCAFSAFILRGLLVVEFLERLWLILEGVKLLADCQISGRVRPLLDPSSLAVGATAL